MTHDEQRQLDRMEEKMDRFMEMTYALSTDLAVHKVGIHTTTYNELIDVKKDVREVRDFIKKAAGVVAVVGIAANWAVPALVKLL